MSQTLWLSPQGHLHPGPSEEPGEEDPLVDFEAGSGHGLFLLGARGIGSALPPARGYWRDFGARYAAALCLRPEGKEAPPASCLQIIWQTPCRRRPPCPGASISPWSCWRPSGGRRSAAPS